MAYMKRAFEEEEDKEKEFGTPLPYEEEEGLGGVVKEIDPYALGSDLEEEEDDLPDIPLEEKDY